MSQRVSLPLDHRLPLPESTARWQGVRVMTQIIIALFLSKEIWIQNFLGFMAARAVLLGDLFPFGPAFFLAVCAGGDRRRSVAALLSVTAGTLTLLPWQRAAGQAVVFLLMIFVFKDVRSHHGPRRLRRQLGLILGASVLLCGARLVPEWLVGVTWFEVVSAVVEAMLVGISAWIMIPGAGQRWFERERYDRNSLVALGMIVSVAGLGLGSVTWHWIEAAEVWNRGVILLAAVIGGAAGGAAIGTTIGVLSSLSGSLPLGGLGLYGVSGLFAGLFARRGKPGAALGLLLGQITVSVHASGAEEIWLGAAHSGISILLFSAVSRRWIGRMQRAIPGSDAQSRVQLAKERRLRAAINERLHQVSSVFSELADVFGAPIHRRVEAVEAEEGIHAIVEHLWSRQCRGCTGFSRCWERNLHNSFWDTVDVAASAEKKGRATVDDLPAGLRSRCVRPREFVSALNEARASNAGGSWTLERLQAMDIVPYQLRGTAELVRSVADQVRTETGRAEELEGRLWEEFSLRKVPVNHIRVVENGDHPEIEVEYSGGCDGYGRCSIPLLDAAEAVTGQEYTCEPVCRSGLEDVCRVRLSPEPPLVLRVEIARHAKGERLISGDTCAQVDLGGGKTALVLSDGMGSGDRASIESQAAVGMLEKMIRAGFDRSFAVRTINSVLLMRSTDEIFATLDLVVVDCFSGRAEFLKMGSSPTFIKRGRDVEVVRSESLPVGILSDIELQEGYRYLQPGDIVVMMTDGILDSFPDQADKEEWIARMLRRVETQEPRELVHRLVDRAKQAAGGNVNDDMTVIVARLEMKPPRVPSEEALLSGESKVV